MKVKSCFVHGWGEDCRKVYVYYSVLLKINANYLSEGKKLPLILNCIKYVSNKHGPPKTSALWKSGCQNLKEWTSL